MNNKLKIKNVNFLDFDSNWNEVIEFLDRNDWSNLTTIAAVEFCARLENCVPYEWSFWQEQSDFQCIILHKGKFEKFNGVFLDDIESSFDYVFGNSVFNIFTSTKLNISNLIGNSIHFSLNPNKFNYYILIEKIKRFFRVGKQFKNKANQKNILLVSANKSGNIGDNAITLASKDILQNIYPDAHIIIDKGPASKELINKVDLVVLGGGGIIYDNYFYNALNYCQYLLYASEFSIKSCAIGIGVQDVSSEFGLDLYRHSLNQLEFIIVRDDNSYHSLINKVQTTTPVIVNRDVVFSLAFNKNLKQKKNNKAVLLFSLIDLSGLIKDNTIQIECMEYLTRHFEVKCILQSHDEMNLYSKYKDQFDIEITNFPYEKTRDVLNSYIKADLVITSRYHGFIFASLAQVPVISVVSDSTESKLGRLISNYLPSSKIGILTHDEYSMTSLKNKIEDFYKMPTKFIPNITETKECQNLINQIEIEITTRIGNL